MVVLESPDVVAIEVGCSSGWPPPRGRWRRGAKSSISYIVTAKSMGLAFAGRFTSVSYLAHLPADGAAAPMAPLELLKAIPAS